MPQQAHLSKKSMKGRPVGEDGGITLTMIRKDEPAPYSQQTSNQSTDNNNRNRYQR